MLNRERSGASVSAMLFVLDASWLTRPKKDLRSVRLLGVGNLDMASADGVPLGR